MKVVQAFSKWEYNGVFGGSDFTVMGEEHGDVKPLITGVATGTEAHVAVPPREPFKLGFRLEYGTSSGKSKGRGWVQGFAPLGNRHVDGVCYHYELNDPADRVRAETAAVAALEAEYVLALAEAQGAQSLRVDGKDVSGGLVCVKCGHQRCHHHDYSGCSNFTTEDGKCGCMEGCKPPPSPAIKDVGQVSPVAQAEQATFKRITRRERAAHPLRTLSTYRADKLGDPGPDPAAIEAGFIEAQKRGIKMELARLGCMGDISEMIVAGITFTTKGDPAMLGKWAYIAGPMRGFPDFNFPAFDAARDVLLAHGFSVISPADVDRADKGPPDPVARTRLYVMRDFWTLYLLSTWGDGDVAQFICFLDGWQCSTGATAEALLARWLSLRPLCINGKLTPPITERPWGNVMRDFATPAAV